MVEVQPEPRAKVAESVARVALVDLQCIPVLQLPEAAGVPELLHAGIQHLLGVGQLAFKLKLERVVVIIVLGARNELLESGYAVSAQRKAFVVTDLPRQHLSRNQHQPYPHGYTHTPSAISTHNISPLCLTCTIPVCSTGYRRPSSPLYSKNNRKCG